MSDQFFTPLPPLPSLSSLPFDDIEPTDNESQGNINHAIAQLKTAHTLARTLLNENRALNDLITHAQNLMNTLYDEHPDIMTLTDDEMTTYLKFTTYGNGGDE